MRNVKFGLEPTPKEIAPWGSVGALDANTPSEDVHLQRFSRIGGNQTVTNSCVWWAFVNAIYNTLRYEGINAKWMSVLAGYFATRMRSNGGKKDRLVDFGCRPPDAAAVVSELGLITDAKWPFIPSRVNEEPDYGALISAVEGWVRMKRIIAPEGQNGAAIRHIIACTHRPVLIGQSVDESYIDWVPGKLPWVLTGEIVGRHMELLDSYNAKGPLAVSSWGDPYRRNIAWRMVEDDNTHELWYLEIDRDKAFKMLGAAQ